MHMFTASGIKWMAKGRPQERLSGREDTFELAERPAFVPGRRASVGLLYPSSLFFFKPAKYE